MTRSENISMFMRSRGEMSIPIDDFEASMIALAFTESMMTSSKAVSFSSVNSFRFLMTLTHLAKVLLSGTIFTLN